MTAALWMDLEAATASAARWEGVIWRLHLGAEPVRFGIGRSVGEHAKDEVDVVFVAVSGSGFVEDEGHEHALEAEKQVFILRTLDLRLGA